MDSINEKLQEMILDENKIVNYKTLSKVCSIHVNLAKKALEQFLNGDADLNACYLLAGYVGKTDKPECYQVAVVPATKLDAARQKFRQVDSCHVYSLQKTPIKDSGSLYCVGDNDLSVSPRSRPAVIQNALIKQTQRQKQPIVAKSTEQSSKNEHSNKPNADLSSTKSESDSTPAVTPNLKNTQPKKTGKSKASTNGKSIMAAFAKGASKKVSPPSKETEKASSTAPLKAQINHTNGATQNKAGKQIDDHTEIFKKAEKQMWSSSESEEEEIIPQKKKMKRIVLPQDSDSEEEIKPSKKKEEDVKKPATTKNNEVKKPAAKKSEVKKPAKQKREDTEKPSKKKKGKRSPSPDMEDPLPAEAEESPFSEEGENEEDVIPPTPEPPKISKQYVTVTNTYQDEEGFLVTRKERKLEEMEVAAPPPRPAPKKSKNNNVTQPKKRQKKSPDAGKKQATLMTFFKKA